MGVDLVDGASPWDVRVSWVAMPCQVLPRIRGAPTDDGRLAIRVDAGPTDNCDSMGVAHGVDLRFTEPIEFADIEASFAR